MNKLQKAIIGVDPGDKNSGIIVIVNGEITFADNLPNENVFDVIERYIDKGVFQGTVVVENIEPYADRLKSNVIGTCKFIGELEYRLKTGFIDYSLVGRSYIKNWVYERFKSTVVPLIEAKIMKRGKVNKDGSYRKPSFAFVDDRIVVYAMKELWGIETPKVGKKNKYGISTHAWQALAVSSFYMHNDFDYKIEEEKRKEKALEKKAKKKLGI